MVFLGVGPMAAIDRADAATVRAPRQPVPAEGVGGLADVLAADDDVGPLRALIALVAVQRDGFFVNFDLAAIETGRDEGFDQGRAVLEAGGCIRRSVT
jgi:hypothetical protein